MTVDHVVRQAQFEADFAHLVLEQFAQRLDQHLKTGGNTVTLSPWLIQTSSSALPLW